MKFKIKKIVLVYYIEGKQSKNDKFRIIHFEWLYFELIKKTLDFFNKVIAVVVFRREEYFLFFDQIQF